MRKPKITKRPRPQKSRTIMALRRDKNKLSWLNTDSGTLFDKLMAEDVDLFIPALMPFPMNMIHSRRLSMVSGPLAPTTLYIAMENDLIERFDELTLNCYKEQIGEVNEETE